MIPGCKSLWAHPAPSGTTYNPDGSGHSHQIRTRSVRNTPVGVLGGDPRSRNSGRLPPLVPVVDSQRWPRTDQCVGAAAVNFTPVGK